MQPGRLFFKPVLGSLVPERLALFQSLFLRKINWAVEQQNVDPKRLSVSKCEFQYHASVRPSTYTSAPATVTGGEGGDRCGASSEAQSCTQTSILGRLETSSSPRYASAGDNLATLVTVTKRCGCRVPGH